MYRMSLAHAQVVMELRRELRAAKRSREAQQAQPDVDEDPLAKRRRELQVGAHRLLVDACWAYANDRLRGLHGYMRT